MSEALSSARLLLGMPLPTQPPQASQLVCNRQCDSGPDLLSGIAARARWLRLIGMLRILAVLTGDLGSCGSSGEIGVGNSYPGTTAGTYTITTTGSSGATTATGTLIPCVQ